jgi:competence protein ComEA
MSRTKQTLSVFFFVILAVTSTLAQSGNQVAKGTTSKTPVTSTSNSKPTSPALVDLNTATKKALMELPGISDVNAQKIIENRPYHAKSDLTEKKVISIATYEKIAKLIGVKTTTRVSPGNVEKKAAASKGTSEVQKKYQ